MKPTRRIAYLGTLPNIAWFGVVTYREPKVCLDQTCRNGLQHRSLTASNHPHSPATAPPRQSPPSLCCQADRGCCRKWKTQTVYLTWSGHTLKARSRG